MCGVNGSALVEDVGQLLIEGHDLPPDLIPVDVKHMMLLTSHNLCLGMQL